MNKDSGHTWGFPEDFKKAVADLEASRARVKELEIQLHQARGALGYPVPGDIPDSDIKCGLCVAKEKDLTKAETRTHTLYQVVKIMAETR